MSVCCWYFHRQPSQHTKKRPAISLFSNLRLGKQKKKKGGFPFSFFTSASFLLFFSSFLLLLLSNFICFAFFLFSLVVSASPSMHIPTSSSLRLSATLSAAVSLLQSDI